MKKFNKDLLKKCLFLAFIVIAITLVISIVIKYSVEGEKTLPYTLEKILIVSRVDATNNEDPENLWNISLKEDNNIFIYIKKNDSETEETIKEIKINNFQLIKSPSVGSVSVARPTGDFGIDLYKYSEQNYFGKEIVYTGAKIDTLKTLEIRNVGGMIALRVSLEDLGTYLANEQDSTEITYDGSLLEKIGIKKSDINFKISFDLTITLSNDISFVGTITLDLPSDDIINDSEPHLEITNFDNIVFKRI